jgi:S1-C subfamily serine protease
MRPRLRIWTLLLIGAIAFVVAMFWVRAHLEDFSPKDPLTKSQEAIQGSLGMEVEKDSNGQGGLRVLDVDPRGAAAQAGVQAGDRVIAVLDRSVWHVYQFQELVVEGLESLPALFLLLERDGSYLNVALSSGIDPDPLFEDQDPHDHSR